MRRLLLVSANEERRPYPVPPLGLCLVAESLADELDVVVYDGLSGTPAALQQVVRQVEPDVVGMGIRNFDDPCAIKPHRYLEQIRSRFVGPLREVTEAPLVLGGSGFSLFPKEIADFLGANAGVIGAGEEALKGLLRTWAAEGPPAAGACHLVDGRITKHPSEQKAEDVLCLPWSRLDRWIDFEPYRQRGAYPIQTKRGCAQRCIYCTYPALEGRRVRLRSPESIADEVSAVREQLGDVVIELVDSVFNDPVAHAEEVCRSLIRRSLSLRLRTMGLNPRLVTGSLLAVMQEAGFEQVDCTPDTAAPKVLEMLGKGFGRPQLEQAARCLRQAGLPTMWFFLIGGPGETKETFAETVDFIDRFVAPDDMVLLGLGLRIYPGTPLHRLALRQGTVRPGCSLWEPCFYVSPSLDLDGWRAEVEEVCALRPHCLPAWDSTPSPAMVARALEWRRATGSREPFFRTLLRLRQQGWTEEHCALRESGQERRIGEMS